MATMKSNFDVTCPTCESEDTVLSAVDPNLLCSNHAPSAVEAQYILRSIAHGNSHLQSLETQIRRVRETLASLEQRQEIIKNHVSSQKHLLSPIRRIPPEILGQIFLALRNVSVPICFGDDALENIDQWALLYVCRFWRDVASSLSELWSRFTVVRQPFSNRPSGRGMDRMLQQTLHLTKNCISYSHTRPLHFVFHAGEEFIKAGQMLAVESRRWTSVAFNSLPVLQTLEPHVVGRLPSLHSLDIDGLGKEWDSQTRPLRAFQQAPNLTHLSLYELERPHNRFILPWRQITHLTSSGLRQLLPLLCLMPCLVEFKSTEDTCELNEIQERILLPNLERLEVTSNSPTTSQIFDALLTPKLNALRLFSKRGFSRIYASAVVQMIQASECSLRTLDVSDYAIDSIFQIIQVVRDLEELTVTNLMYPSELLSGMEGAILPGLHSLVLRKCAPGLNIGAHLVQLLRARTLTSGTQDRRFLGKISIGLSSSPNAQFLRNWKDIIQQVRQIDCETQVELIGLFDFVYPISPAQW